MRDDVVIHYRNPLLHVVGCAVAIIVYILLLFALFYQSQQNIVIDKEDSTSEMLFEDTIELANVVVEPTIPKEQDIKEEVTTQESLPKEEELQKPKETIQEIKAPTPAPVSKNNADLSDVFSNISSQTAHNRREEEKKQREEEEAIKQKELQALQAQKRKEQLAQSSAAIRGATEALENATKNLSKDVTEVLNTKIDIQRPPISKKADKEKYDKWYAAIETIFMQEWKKSKKTYQTTGAVISIKFDSKGRLKFLHMVKASPYADYNDSVISFIKQMEARTFPPTPDSEPIEFNINLNSARR